MGKVKQFVQVKDDLGMLKNLSELLQEVRDGNIESMFLGYTRKSRSTRTFWYGKDIPELNLLLDIMKSDLLSNRFDEQTVETYSGKE